MFRILVMNGLLISLILIWTSAAKEPSAGTLINSSSDHPTEPLNYSMKETNMEIRSRKTLCSRELGGRCVSKKKSCPSNLPFQKSPGKPYCSKKNHCCYPGSIIEIEDLLFQKSENDDDVNWSAIRNACVKGNNHKIYEQVTIDICKEKCVEEDAINCQSIEYSSGQQMCAISEERSDSDDFIEPCFVDGWIFAEIELNTVKCIDVKGQKRCEYWEKNFQYCSKGKYIDYMAFYCKNTCLKCEDKCIDVKGQKRCEYWEKNFNYCSLGKYIDYMTIYCTKTCLKCEDKKECEINNGGCDHICTDTIGSHICSCQEGYSLDDDQITCIDTKECEVNNGGCGHICTDTIGSHICSCQEGYTLDDDRKACIDNKECEVNNGGCDHICTDTIGSYICSCQEGYTLDDDRKACIDVNWSTIRNACVKGNNYKIYEEVTIDICKEKCVEEVDINCQSIEYSSAQQMCAISEVRSDSDDFIEPCFVDGWVFAEREFNAGSTTDAPTTTAPGNTTTNGPTTGAPTTTAPSNTTTNGLTTGAPTTTAPGNTTTNGTTTGAPTTTAPSNTTTNVQTTGAPTSTAPSNTTTNVTSCNLVWKYEEDRPLIMIWGGQTVVPPITDIDISNDPNRFPEKNYLIFACPGENNIFKHVDGNHTKLHGECISHDQFQVCVNNYSEIMDLSNLSCRSKMHPSIIKQVNDTSYKKSCEDIGGELYKIGYIYGDKKEFKDLDTKVCFSEKDQTTLWTSTNIEKIETSSSTRYEDPTNFRTARGFAIKTFYSQKSQHELLKEVLDKEATSVWNEKACRNHGGHCVRGGKPCPNHLPHQTSQGEPFCSSFYRCCYSGDIDEIEDLQSQKSLGKIDEIEDSRSPRSSDCNIAWNTNWGGFQPLFYHTIGTANIILSVETVKENVELFVACAGLTNVFQKYEKDVHFKVKCKKQKLTFIGKKKRCGEEDKEPDTSLEDLACSKENKRSLGDTINQDRKKCGKDLNGETYIVGYHIKHLALNIVIPLIEICFIMGSGTTVWTRHTLQVEIDNQKEDGNKRSYFRNEGFHKDIKSEMANIYMVLSQFRLFEQLLNRKDILCNTKGLSYLAKGHMAPRSDFLTTAEQDATYYFMNTFPQWSDINGQGGNWALIERRVQAFAKDNKKKLIIFSGGYGILKLKKKFEVGVKEPANYEGEEIFLGNYYEPIGDNEEDPKFKLTTTSMVQVPAFTWKIVLDENRNGIAFVVVNNPLIDKAVADKEYMCDIPCDNMKWLLNGEIENPNTIKPYKRFNEPGRGLTYCCSVKEFLIKYSKIGEIGEIEIDDPDKINPL